MYTKITIREYVVLQTLTARSSLWRLISTVMILKSGILNCVLIPTFFVMYVKIMSSGLRPKKDEVRRDCGILHTRELHDLCNSHRILWVVILKKVMMCCVCGVDVRNRNKSKILS
jgi:hypothetical protein